MSHRLILPWLVLSAGLCRADTILYQYEGDVLPYDPSAGWLIFDSCPFPTCEESVQSGDFRLDWPGQFGNAVNYHRWIAQSPTPSPQPAFWAEWRFASSSPKPTTQAGCDGQAVVGYWQIGDLVYVHGDAAVSFEGGDVVSGLELTEFYTLRFETLDGLNYIFSLNGQVFMEDVGHGAAPTQNPYLQFGGSGACQFGAKWNRWDYIRYGNMTTGEAIQSASPPAGYLDPEGYAGLDRFTVTLDEPGYVHIDDVAVAVSSGVAPVVLKTRRGHNYSPSQIEIVLDRPLTVGETTTFTFAGLAPEANSVSYTLAIQIPASSPMLVVLGAVGILGAAILVLRRRHTAVENRGNVG